MSKNRTSTINNKAMGFVRVSGLGQEHNQSTALQEEGHRRYCEENGLELVEIVPLVETARRTDLRKEYHEARNRALRLGIGNLLFSKYDREARNLTDNEDNENLVRQGKIVLHYISDNKILHKNSPDSDFFQRDIQAVVNKHYSRDLSSKIKSAMAAKAAQGWSPIARPREGYINQKPKKEKGLEGRRGSTIVIDGNCITVKRVQREFEIRAESPTPSLVQVRKRVIAEGLIAPSEIKKYHVGTIERRLKNIFYDGRFHWQGVEHIGNHPRIIPKEIFWSVQETFGHRNPYGKKNGLFQNGWIRCGVEGCGCSVIFDPMTKTIKKTAEKKTYRYYHCTNGKAVHSSLCGLRITEEEIIEKLSPAVRQISIAEDFRDELLAALNEAQTKARRAIKRDIENYQAALLALQEKENRTYDKYDCGEIDKDTYNQQRIRLQDEQLCYSELMKKAQLGINDVTNETVQSILQLATNAESLWQRRNSQERRNLLERLLSNRVWDGVSVQYELVKPLQTLSEMKQDKNWRRG